MRLLILAAGDESSLLGTLASGWNSTTTRTRSSAAPSSASEDVLLSTKISSHDSASSPSSPSYSTFFLSGVSSASLGEALPSSTSEWLPTGTPQASVVGPGAPVVDLALSSLLSSSSLSLEPSSDDLSETEAGDQLPPTSVFSESPGLVTSSESSWDTVPSFVSVSTSVHANISLSRSASSQTFAWSPTISPQDPEETSARLSTPTSGCVKPGNKETTIVVTHTTTTTFYGDPTDYTPPYPELTRPTFCSTRNIDLEPPVTVTCSKIDGHKDCETFILEFPLPTVVDQPVGSETFTFITTDKNPSVVFSSVNTPGYGKQTDLRDDNSHETARPNRPPNTKTTKAPHPAPAKPSRPPTYTITAAPTKVVIQDKTVTVRPDQTTHVSVGGEHFTINPSQVIGGGQTIGRPWYGDGSGNNGPVVPSHTNVGAIPIVMAPSGKRSVAVLDGTTISIPPGGTTAVVQGTTVTLEASAIRFPSHTVGVNNIEPTPTELVVEGGEMVTAIGSTLAVIDGTTITYAGGSPARTSTIDGDEVVIGLSGVVVGGSTLGGPEAEEHETSIDIAGGLTVTQIGSSIAVIAGTTYTVGPSGDQTRAEIGGRVVTVGPSGIFVGKLNMPYPFGPTVVSTIEALPSSVSSVASATTSAGSEEDSDEDDDKTSSSDQDLNAGSERNGGGRGAESGETADNEEENGQASLKDELRLRSFRVLLCIAIGVWNLGNLL